MGGTIDKVLDELGKADLAKRNNTYRNANNKNNYLANYNNNQQQKNTYRQPNRFFNGSSATPQTSTVIQAPPQQFQQQPQQNRLNFPNARMVSVTEEVELATNSNEEFEPEHEQTYDCAIIFVKNDAEILEERTEEGGLEKRHSSPFIKIEVEGKSYSALIDCGSEVCLVAPDWFKSLTSSLVNCEQVPSKSLVL
jgi:hypothetical protein